MKRYDVVIVGTGHAGAQAAISLRQRGFAGSILMLGGETEPPYERPPLSKDYLAGTRSFERILLRPLAFWSAREIDLRLGAEVIAVDAERGEVTLREGEPVAYGSLIWAAGGEARRLGCPGEELAGIHRIRRKADADRLLAQLERGSRRAVIVGGGYVGLEAAAVLRGLGLEVTVVEVQDRLLARVAGADLADFYATEHRRRGVELRLGETVERFAGRGGAVTAAILASGERLACDLAIVGVGLEPCVGPLLDCGAAGGNGVLVDVFCRTSLPEIYAAGDCAIHPSAHAGDAFVRLESVQNAHDMAETVASCLCGEPRPYESLPWFWSHQYDLKLQTLGISAGHDAAVVRGDPRERAFSIVYLRQGRVIALDCVNRMKDFAQGRKLLGRTPTTNPSLMADCERPIAEFAGAD